MQCTDEKHTPGQNGNSELACIMMDHLASKASDILLYETEISDRLFSILSEIRNYIPESEQDDYNNVVMKASGKDKIFTSENVKYLLSLIIPILFQIFSNSQPREMTEYEKRSLRNEEIISQQIGVLENFAEQIAAQSPDLSQVIDALVEVVETIKDAEIPEEEEQYDEQQNAVPYSQNRNSAF